MSKVLALHCSHKGEAVGLDSGRIVAASSALQTFHFLPAECCRDRVAQRRPQSGWEVGQAVQEAASPSWERVKFKLYPEFTGSH